jgi:hypothetical protein
MLRVAQRAASIRRFGVLRHPNERGARLARSGVAPTQTRLHEVVAR